MLQQVIVILIVAACGAWLAVKGVRFWRPKKSGGGGCGAGCCNGKEEMPKRAVGTAGAGAERVLMIRSDDLRARIAARKA